MPYRAIVFLKDTGEIWTHGRYYTGYRAVLCPVKVYLNYDWPITIKDERANWALDRDDILGDDYGSYMIQISNNFNGDVSTYTGCFSYTMGDGTDEEIVLHRSGNKSGHRIFAKIKYMEDANAKGHPYLLLCCSKADGTYTEDLTITFKRIIAWS